MKKYIICLFVLCLIFAGCTAEPEITTGWVDAENGTQYYDAAGVPVTGWQEIDENRYYFSEDGLLFAGWLTAEEQIYYLSDAGIPVTGWQEIDGRRYYFQEDGSMVTGWLLVDGREYYLQEDGTPTVGLMAVNGKTLIFDETGALYTGFVDTEGKPCHMAAEGAIASNWAEYDGKTYYLNEDGTLYSGWLEADGKQYYFHGDGTMAVGEVVIEEKTYHFNPHGVRVVLVNPWNYIPDDYEENVVRYDSSFYIGETCYDALLEMMDACRAAGFNPVLVSGYRTHQSQVWLFENRVNRWMAQGYDKATATELAGTSVAVPGTSEHQLGLAVDLVDASNYSLDETQESTPAQQWLMEHCWEYGFILRYPSDKSDITGIIYEPWHYRYVGTEISLELKELGITLEEYLGASSHK